MGTQAQALGLKRDYSGLLGRADRLVLLIIFPFFQMIFVIFKWTFLNVTLLGWNFSLNLMDGLMLWFAIAGNTTAVQRAYNTWEELSKQEADAKAKMEKKTGKEEE
jgi:archaetidylinositol phosphate synthase